MTNIQKRLTERYKGYKQKELYQPKKNILNKIKNNSDDYLRVKFKVDLYELAFYYNDLGINRAF